MAEIVITEFMDETAVDMLRADYQTHYDPALVDNPDELMARIGDCRALVVRNRTQVRGKLLEVASRLEVVGRLGVGLDNIDLEACRARRIEVCPAAGANDDSVAEYVIATAMLLLRGAYDAQSAMLAGAWPRGQLMGRELAGKQIGLVGLGSIARKVAARAMRLGMSVAAYDPFVSVYENAWDGLSKLELDALLASSDVVSLHVPLNDATRHLIGPSRLALMRSDAILINAARGGVVDEAAVAAALRQQRLGGAALDVFESEPLSAEAAKVFQDTPNLILTPHIAGVTVVSNQRVSAVTAENVRRVLAARA